MCSGCKYPVVLEMILESSEKQEILKFNRRVS